MPSAPDLFVLIMRRPGFWAWMWVLWFVMLFYLSSLSQPGPIINIKHIDKITHVFYFALGGISLVMWRALSGRKSARRALRETNWKLLFLLSLLAGAGIGAFDEWHQSYTPHRSGLDKYDWIADMAGSLMAVPIARILLYFMARSSVEKQGGLR